MDFVTQYVQNLPDSDLRARLLTLNYSRWVIIGSGKDALTYIGAPQTDVGSALNLCALRAALSLAINVKKFAIIDPWMPLEWEPEFLPTGANWGQTFGYTSITIPDDFSDDDLRDSLRNLNTMEYLIIPTCSSEAQIKEFILSCFDGSGWIFLSDR
ncbi:MAG: hypothetical protein RIA71_14865 [Oceanicaulis sp.]